MPHFEIIKGGKAVFILFPEGTVFNDNQIVTADEEKALSNRMEVHKCRQNDRFR